MIFKNRLDAGKQLGREVKARGYNQNCIILGLPRGGVPIAYEVAKAIDAPLDVLVVRKLGVPGHEELAMGAIATGGGMFVSEELVRTLNVPKTAFDRITRAERRELQRRERAYRHNRPKPNLRDRITIVVDDGLATGATMQAAISALQPERPKAIVVAVPVAARETCQMLSQEAEEIICLETPHPFRAVGLWYEDFPQTSDEEVRWLLQQGQLSA